VRLGIGRRRVHPYQEIAHCLRTTAGAPAPPANADGQAPFSVGCRFSFAAPSGGYFVTAGRRTQNSATVWAGSTSVLPRRPRGSRHRMCAPDGSWPPRARAGFRHAGSLYRTSSAGSPAPRHGGRGSETSSVAQCLSVPAEPFLPVWYKCGRTARSSRLLDWSSLLPQVDFVVRQRATKHPLIAKGVLRLAHESTRGFLDTREDGDSPLLTLHEPLALP
jgi:hypothetical protein